jgi:L-fucose mutarotase
MGHGDEIAIVDGNYPGVEHARRLIRLDGHRLIPVLNAVLSVLPIDDIVPEAIFRSTVKAERDKLDPVHEEMIDCCALHEPHRQVVPLVGQDFYGRVRAAHALIQTSEPRLYDQHHPAQGRDLSQGEHQAEVDPFVHEGSTVNFDFRFAVYRRIQWDGHADG